ncbi:hypothetical protein TRICI_000027 [Trichomonascus ciferrii]|uniref:Probable endonuclease LCL3 n=1 Tax=Trichomonascus ciferrii TaxID=44093 RepID=A0A642VEL0_9ASCO|nr:hypothetical protein TRICI_000027 [Trichomonascus ciferrii]
MGKNEGDKENDSPRKNISFFSTEVLYPTTILTSSFLGGFYLYRMYFRRIPNSRRIPDYFFKRRKMVGRVTSVGDADNFHFYHTPGGVFAGWGWLRHAPVNKRGLGDQTIHVRLCGVDAPEGAHFGKPAQKWSGEALQWLRGTLLGKRVVLLPLSRDQYQRTVGEATIWTWLGRRNVSAEMLKNGWAVVYEGKIGSEFNGNEEWFRQLEAEARKKRIGIFQGKKKDFISPGQFKRLHR